MDLAEVTTMLSDMDRGPQLVLGIIFVYLIYQLFLYLKMYCSAFNLMIRLNMALLDGNQKEEKKEAYIPNGGRYQTQWIDRGFGYGYGEMNPSQRLPDLIQEFGPPDMFDGGSGGGAVWYKDSLQSTPFERIEIKDEQIPHNGPSKHTDFLYSWHHVEMPEYLIGGVHKISESITYDPLKKLSRARCHDMRPNVVSHWIVKKYAEEEITIDEAVGMYGPMIAELFDNDSTGSKYRELLSEL